MICFRHAHPWISFVPCPGWLAQLKPKYRSKDRSSLCWRNGPEMDALSPSTECYFSCLYAIDGRSTLLVSQLELELWALALENNRHILQ